MNTVDNRAESPQAEIQHYAEQLIQSTWGAAICWCDNAIVEWVGRGRGAQEQDAMGRWVITINNEMGGNFERRNARLGFAIRR